jgi:phosphoglycolate phosphatase
MNIPISPDMALDPRYKAVGFDMDGTFMDTVVDYVKLANVIYDDMAELGVPESAIRRSGGAKFEIESGMEWLKKNGRADDAYSIYDRIADRTAAVEMEHIDLAKPFDGAVDVLELLKKKGYKVGILTRGCRRYAESVLGMNGLLDKFDALVARDDHPEEDAKPSPVAMENLAKALNVKASEILFLGDHKFDWLTARDSGAGFYGVLTGGYDKEDWETAGKNIQVIDSVASLKDKIGFL